MMDKKTYDLESAERMTPLLRSITKELRERRLATEIAEHELAMAKRAGDTDHAARLEAELSTHRRELRQVTKEVERLGLELDATSERILIPSADGAWAYEGNLGDTRFFQRLEDLPA